MAPSNAPVGDTTLPTGIAQDAFKLNALFNPLVQETTVRFEYAESLSLLANNPTVVYSPTTSALAEPVPFQAQVTVSSGPLTLYYCRAIASNASGEREGKVIPFRTGAGSTTAPPMVQTIEPIPVTITSAKLLGALSANGLSTTYLFEWRKAGGPGSVFTRSGMIDTTIPGTPQTITPAALITGLEPLTDYVYRLGAVSAGWANVRWGDEWLFTTGNFPLPTIDGFEVTQIAQTSALLDCTVYLPAHPAAPDPSPGDTWSWFAYGTESSATGDYPAVLPEVCHGDLEGPSGFGQRLGASPFPPLQPGTTYFARCFVRNLGGEAMSDELTWTTLP